MEEVWKNIEGYGGYQASNYGRIKRGDKILGQYPDHRGYLITSMVDNKNKRLTKKIHHLVWDAFGDEQRNGHKKQIDHIDNNPLNNRFDNLRLVSASQNSVKRSSLKEKSSEYPNVNLSNGKYWEMSIMRNRKRYRKNGFHTETQAFLYRQKVLLSIGEPIS